MDLADAVLAAQIAAGADIGDTTVTLDAEVNDDQKIGIAEMIYIFQRITGLRQQ